MSSKFTYADAGVDRELRADSKKALENLKETYRFNHYGKVLELPYGNIFPFMKNCYLDLVIEGVGTKVLVAQLIEKYDTIGIDGVAMAVNDVIRSGARPLAVSDNIHAQISNPTLVKEWLKGIAEGAAEAECIVPSGEIGDMTEVIRGLGDGKGFDMVVAAIGEVAKENVITGRNVKTGDAIVGLRSSGVHSNGMSLARKILLKHWGGRYESEDVPDGLEKPVAAEILQPTRIYVRSFLRTTEEVEVKAAVHITGDAYLKFNRLARFSSGIGFEFNSFSPQPIFKLIQETASELGGLITDEEMFKTFNMGWGFAIVVDRQNAEEAIDTIEKAGVESAQIGQVTDSVGVRVFHGREKIVLK